MTDHYKITIERVYDVETTHQRWETLEVRPLTQEEYNNVYAFERERGDKVMTKEIRGYTPPIKTTKQETTKLYEQVVPASSFDLTSVVCAVNGLKEGANL